MNEEPCPCVLRNNTFAVTLLPHQDQRQAEFFFEGLGVLLHGVVRRFIRSTGFRRENNDYGIVVYGYVYFFDNIFIRMIRGFGQGEENGHFPNNFPVLLRRDIGVPVSTLNFAADAVVKACNKSGDHLFALRHTVNGSVTDHEGRVARVIVEVDTLADIVQESGRNEETANAVIITVQGL